MMNHQKRKSETEEPKDEDKKDILPESPKEEQQSKEVNPENEPGLFVNEKKKKKRRRNKKKLTLENKKNLLLKKMKKDILLQEK